MVFGGGEWEWPDCPSVGRSPLARWRWMSEKLGTGIIQKTPIYRDWYGIYRDLWGIIEISRNLRDFTAKPCGFEHRQPRDLVTVRVWIEAAGICQIFVIYMQSSKIGTCGMSTSTIGWGRGPGPRIGFLSSHNDRTSQRVAGNWCLYLTTG